jgi:hypothetical protein
VIVSLILWCVIFAFLANGCGCYEDELCVSLDSNSLVWEGCDARDCDFEMSPACDVWIISISPFNVLSTSLVQNLLRIVDIRRHAAAKPLLEFSEGSIRTTDSEARFFRPERYMERRPVRGGRTCRVMDHQETSGYASPNGATRHSSTYTAMSLETRWCLDLGQCLVEIAAVH